MQPETRIAWVTGAAGGIGRATVARLSRAGFRVVATDLNVEQPSTDGPVSWSRLDVTDESAVADCTEDIERRRGRLDAVVHLAGRVGRGPLVANTLQAWRDGLELNLTSAFLVARAAHPLLVQGAGASFVLMSSTNGLNGGSVLSGPAYAVAKAGIVNLTRYLAKEWAVDGIRVNCVAPGPVDTPMLARLDAAIVERLVAATPLGRLATAGDVAACIEYLCLGSSAFLTGTVHNVSGGMVLD
jgi:NAD(P)-dependent dehydrogenase (short-subunit alcohol dehydrogenase family)